MDRRQPDESGDVMAEVKTVAERLAGFNRKDYSLKKKSINRQGYDSRGQYYGAGGNPLYVAEHKPSDKTIEFRAKDKPTAEKILVDWARHGHPRTTWWLG